MKEGTKLLIVIGTLILGLHVYGSNQMFFRCKRYSWSERDQVLFI